MSNTEFSMFPKIARLSRECIVTEKIDGTNAQIFIGEDGEFLVGSRTRWITPEDDNYGFAAWAHEHKDELMKLGVGRHFGEWWGQKIQRKYGMDHRRFSLFNTIRWCEHDQEPERIPCGNPNKEKWQVRLPVCCHLVPILYRGVFCTSAVDSSLEYLNLFGSFAAPKYMNPEGVVCYHIAANKCFKKTLNDDGVPKSVAKQWRSTK